MRTIHVLPGLKSAAFPACAAEVSAPAAGMTNDFAACVA
jgi:hypothetical protein